MALEQNNWWDNLVWGLLLLFLIPSGLVVASWNSLPGSRMYQVKIFMEDALLTVAPTVQAKGELHVAFTERRFSEAKQLLADKGSTEGLVYLNEQVLQAKENIQKAPNREVRAQLARKYITTLKNVNTQLEQQKQIMSSNASGTPPSPSSNRGSSGAQNTPRPATPAPTGAPPVSTGGVPSPTAKSPTHAESAPTATPSPAPTATPVPAVANPSPPASSDGNPVDVISDTQDQIDQTIGDLQSISAESVNGAPAAPAGDTNENRNRHENNQDRSRRTDNSRGNDNNNRNNGNSDDNRTFNNGGGPVDMQ